MHKTSYSFTQGAGIQVSKLEGHHSALTIPIKDTPIASGMLPLSLSLSLSFDRMRT
jgi:hypothetical protein